MQDYLCVSRFPNMPIKPGPFQALVDGLSNDGTDGSTITLRADVHADLEEIWVTEKGGVYLVGRIGTDAGQIERIVITLHVLLPPFLFGKGWFTVGEVLDECPISREGSLREL